MKLATVILFAGQLAVFGASGLGGTPLSPPPLTSSFNSNTLSGVTNNFLYLRTVGDSGSLAYGIHFIDPTNGGDYGSIIENFNAGHPTSELILNANNTGALIGGIDGQQRGGWQMGYSTPSTTPIGDAFWFQYDKTPTAGSPLGFSKYVAWIARHHTGSAIIQRSMGFRLNDIDQAGNVILNIYSELSAFNQGLDDSGRNTIIGGFGTNAFFYKNAVFTNSVILGGNNTVSGSSSFVSTQPFLDVGSGYLPGIVVGADTSSNIRTPGNNKLGSYSFISKDCGTLTPFGLFRTDGGIVQATGNVLDIGGGSGSLQFVDAIELFAGSAGGVQLLTRSTGTQFQNGIAADGSGMKHKRLTTGSVSGGSTALVTCTWSTAFADASYTVQASVQDSTTTSLSLSVVHIESVTASAVTVRVLNSAVGALTGTLHVFALHD